MRKKAKAKISPAKKSKTRRKAIKDLKVSEEDMRKVTGGVPIVQRKGTITS